MTEGIFHQLATSELFSFINDDNKSTLDVDYYLSHSGLKLISNLYCNIERLYPDDNPLTHLSSIIIERFQDKWLRIYNALILTDYKPLDNYNMVEVETPDLEEHRVTKVDSKVTTNSKINDYGFNSTSPVGVSDNTNTIEGVGDNNKTDDTITHTGERTLTRSGNIGVTTSQQMLESELKLRALNNMRDIIFHDVDSVLCLSIY